MLVAPLLRPEGLGERYKDRVCVIVSDMDDEALLSAFILETIAYFLVLDTGFHLDIFPAYRSSEGWHEFAREQTSTLNRFILPNLQVVDLPIALKSPSGRGIANFVTPHYVCRPLLLLACRRYFQ